MNMWMQHDGAPLHYALCSRQVMNEIFDKKWIGRGGPLAWPPRSPDLTSPDHFVWGFVKERVMAVPPICFDFSTIFILCVTRMTLCCRSLNSS